MKKSFSVSRSARSFDFSEIGSHEAGLVIFTNRKIYYKLDDICRDIAYELWQSDGSPEGQAEHYWYAAEKILDEQGFDIKIRETIVYKDMVMA